jgi:hypothetical protein
MIMNVELGSMCKELVVAFRIELSQRFPGGIEGNNGNYQSK